MFINLYIARLTYRFILIYTAVWQLLLNEYVMLCYDLGMGYNATAGNPDENVRDTGFALGVLDFTWATRPEPRRRTGNTSAYSVGGVA